MNAHGLPQPASGAPRHCPDCAVPLGPSGRACPRCGLSLVGPTAQRLWWIDTELETLRGRERALSQERPHVLGRLRRESAEPAHRARPVPVPPAPASVGPPSARQPSAPGPARTAEVSQRSAQNVILGLGGLLIGVAALVFAIWTWSDMSTGTRAGVLGLTTLTFAGLALPLHRRGLRATAETFGSVAAGLLCVDALALWLLSDQISNGPGYTAAALAIMSALLLLYPALVPLRSPRVLAALFAQPVPVLLVVSLPSDGNPGWLMVVVAATALADLVAVRVLGEPRPGVPVRTLRASAVTLWVLTLAVTVVAVLAAVTYSSGHDPLGWWSMATALLLAGVVGLLLDRWRLGATSPGGWSGFAVVGLGALALAPLVAGPPHLPVLPRLTTLPWSLEPSAMTLPALELLQLEQASTLPPLNLVYLAGILVAAGLAVGAVWTLRRSALPVVLSLVAPAILLALPLLFGLPQVVAVVWALLAGGALVLGSALLGRWTGAVPVVSGTLTLVTGLVWALPERYTTLAAVLMLAATALVCAIGARRFSADGTRHEPGGRAATLFMGGILLWALALVVGVAFLLGNRGADGTVQAHWWLLTAAALLSGATALTLGRVLPPAPSGSGGDVRSDPRRLFGVVGLALLSSAPLLALPGNVPAPPLLPATVPLSAPSHALWAPAHVVLGVPAQAGLLATLGVLVAGALVAGLVAVIDRHRFPAGAALVAPPTLVPLPVLLGAPFLVAVVWTALVGAALFLWTHRLRSSLAWLPGVSGLATMLLGLGWALPQQYAALVVLVLLALTALVSARLRHRLDPRVPDSPERLVHRLTLTAWALALTTGLGLLVAFAVVGTSDQPSAWLLAAATLVLGATALVLGRTDRERRERPTGRERPLSPFSFGVVGVLLLALVPLLAGPRGLPALALFSRSHPVGGAPLSALLEPAHVFVGLSGPDDARGALTVAVGLLTAGALALVTVRLVDRTLLVPVGALVAPLTLLPLPVALGLPFLVALPWTLLVGALLLAGSALLREGRVAWIPWASGLFSLALGLSWALSERHTTVAVLMASAAVLSVVTALARTRFVAIASTSVGTAATGGFALALPLALGAPIEYAVLAPLAVVAAVATVAPRLREPLVTAAEVPATAWAGVTLLLSVLHGGRPELVATALAVVGVISLASAVRPNRRWYAGVGAVLMFLALWTALASWEVTVPEAYTVPPALAFLVIGWEWSRRATEVPSSWLAYGGGLALLLGPTVWEVLTADAMVWRLPAVLVVGLAVTVWGLRGRLLAALVLGGLALLVTSLRAFGPPLWEWGQLAPNWLPFAVIGAALLLVGARYEASLARLRRVGRYLSRLR
ncbi:DUF2157 domain-containing protein [Nocardiopsis eucommiae]|uniref:DUF2157 domain-containing protein n=1 Tax=Nocardiopsis eucommiae TaxID=2831970 RepID=UPI003D757799